MKNYLNTTGLVFAGIGTNVDLIRAEITGGMNTSVGSYMGLVIKVWLSIQGLMFLGLMIAAGFAWMSSDKPDAIKEAGTKITNATIGLVLTAAAYAITIFVFEALDKLKG